MAVLISAGSLTFYFYTHRALVRIPDDPGSNGRVVFYAIGDQGGGGIKQWAVARAMEKHAESRGELDFVVLMGDNFYIDDELTLDSPEWMSRFERVYAGRHLSATPFYAVLGNHDYGKPDNATTGSAQQHPEVQIEYSRRQRGSNRWRMPDRYYSASFGRAGGQALLKIVFLDTNLSREDLSRQADFVREQFSAASGGAVWKIAVGHHPVRTYGKHFGEKQEIGEILLPAMKDAQVDAYLSGHDHNQQVIARDGEPFYFINGGGGGRLHKIRRQSPDLKFASLVHGFLSVEVTATALSLGIHDKDGTAIAAFRIDRNCPRARAECLRSAP